MKNLKISKTFLRSLFKSKINTFFLPFKGSNLFNLSKKDIFTCSIDKTQYPKTPTTMTSVCQNIDLSSISKNCFVQQISTSCIAHFSYYIEADGCAIIIDPIRDIEVYLKIIKERSSTLSYIGESHFHADFVSGHYELSQKTGAPILFGPGAKADFKIVNTKHEGIFELSDKVKIQILHTPGHTMESCCFLILEKVNNNEYKKIAVFTGDTIFLGDVGRPDLAVKSDLTSKDLATLMFESVKYIKTLPDDCLIFPGHGAGSACGKNIQSGNYCTIGNQKKTNYAFNDNLTKNEFVEILTSNIPTPPQYFFFDAMMNHKALQSMDAIMYKSLKPIPIKKFIEITKDPSIRILDTRDHKHIFEGIIPKSYAIDLKMTYAIWAATLFKPTDRIIIVSEKGKEEESITRLTRVGFENIIGYLEGGFDSWTNNNQKVNKVHFIDKDKVPDSIRKALKENKLIIDVRNKNELDTCFPQIKGTEHYPLNTLESNIDKLDKLKKEIYILCKTGMRATVASSIIKKYYDIDVYVFEGGSDNLKKLDFKL